MAKKKSEIDLGKGFQRLFNTIAAIWGLGLLVYTLAESADCLPAPGFNPPEYCESFWYQGWIGPILAAAIGWVITTIPTYYFLRWIILGFKK